MWSREEGLSDIKQIEIMHVPVDSIVAAHTFEYVKHWNFKTVSPT